ncbi:MAG: hypothetical protein GF387_02380 [Candidatus Portnoybacteria bacterium]|nr:hypothetical protein [Candidatus Portnoybacteria bacterium]
MKNKNNKNKKIVTIIIFIIIFGILFYWIGVQANDWWELRKKYVERGLAEDHFPYRLYTAEELAEQGKYPESLYEDVPTRVRPEETYAKFRQALIDENFEKAAECFIEEYRKEWKDALYEIKEQGYLQEMIEDLPEKIEDVPISGSLTEYEYITSKEGKNYFHVISFIKNKEGDWLIEDL